MADKEASVFVIDLGRSMNVQHHDRSESDLDYSLQYFWDKIANIVYLDRKGLMAGLVGFRTDKTKHHLMNQDGYDHITVVQPIQNILMPELRELPKQLKPSSTDTGDALSAVILGVDMIMKHCRELKYTKRLYLITNGTGSMDADDIESTAAQIKQQNIQLTVLGTDFDDAEYGFKEEDKPFQKKQNESALRRLAELSDGIFATMAEAIEGLQRPYLKSTKPVPSYKGQLRLGNPEDYDTAITIDIERYPKVMIRKPPSASSYVHRDDNASQTQQSTDEGDLASVRNDYSYSVLDEEMEGGSKFVSREDLAKGYEYGRTAVHISQNDENVTKLETFQSYEILGFIPQENVERYVFLGQTHMIVAQKLNDKAVFALSSLIHALFEVGSVAIARLVKKNMAEPQLTMLSPQIDSDIECLIENDLPFAEDLRIYRFPPVDKVITVSGKSLSTHRNLPSSDLMDTMSNYMDSMSLVNASTSEQRFPMEDVYSPLLHTIESAVKFRAVYPKKQIPAKPEILLEPSVPPQDIQASSKSELKRLVSAADVKKVPPKVKGRARYRDREADKPISGLDIDALLKKSSGPHDGNKSSTEIRIDPKNAIPDFKRFLEHSGEQNDKVGSVVTQMRVIVQDLIRTSFGESNYGQAIEMLHVLRYELGEYEFDEQYNDMIKTFKETLAQGDLGGDRKDFWYDFKQQKLGLLTAEGADDKIAKEARDFYRLNR